MTAAKDFNLDDLDISLDMGDFDLSDLELDLDTQPSASPKTSSRYILPKAFKERARAHQVKYEYAAQLAKELGQAILDGERVNAILSGNFIFGDFFEAFAVETNSLIDELQISTLSISQDNVDSLHNLIKGDYLKKLDIIVSDYWWSHNRANAPYIYDQLDIADKFQFAVAGTHTKIALMRIGNKKIVISGSANLRSSRSVEEIQIETNAELFDFHHDWQSAILDNYGTIKKAIRGEMLFEAITKGLTDEQISKAKGSFSGKGKKQG